MGARLSPRPGHRLERPRLRLLPPQAPGRRLRGRERQIRYSWGEGEFTETHGIFIDRDDFVRVTDRQEHVVTKHTRHGEKLLELGRRGWAMMTVTP